MRNPSRSFGSLVRIRPPYLTEDLDLAVLTKSLLKFVVEHFR